MQKCIDRYRYDSRFSICYSVSIHVWSGFWLGDYFITRPCIGQDVWPDRRQAPVKFLSCNLSSETKLERWIRFIIMLLFLIGTGFLTAVGISWLSRPAGSLFICVYKHTNVIRLSMLDVLENRLLSISVRCDLGDLKRRNGNEWKQISVNQRRGSCGWYSRRSVCSDCVVSCVFQVE